MFCSGCFCRTVSFAGMRSIDATTSPRVTSEMKISQNDTLNLVYDAWSGELSFGLGARPRTQRLEVCKSIDIFRNGIVINGKFYDPIRGSKQTLCSLISPKLHDLGK